MEQSMQTAVRHYHQVVPTIDAPGGDDRLRQALDELMQLHDASCIAPMLLALDDDIEHDEIAFAIVHAAESFEDPIYVRELLCVLVDLYAKAPRWTQVLFLRCLNSPPTAAMLALQLAHAGADVKGQARQLCADLNRIDARFLGKTRDVLFAAAHTEGAGWPAVSPN
jgi:hypothetical protein